MTKVFYVGASKFVPYVAKDHKEWVESFLYWNELLIIGPWGTHKWLYEAYCQLLSWKRESQPSSDDLLAAGDCELAQVRKWSSSTYELETPDELKPKMLELLQMTENIRR